MLCSSAPRYSLPPVPQFPSTVGMFVSGLAVAVRGFEPWRGRKPGPPRVPRVPASAMSATPRQSPVTATSRVALKPFVGNVAWTSSSWDPRPVTAADCHRHAVPFHRYMLAFVTSPFRPRTSTRRSATKPFSHVPGALVFESTKNRT